MNLTDYDFNIKRVFISGPMTGCDDWNRKAFAETEAYCLEHGALEVFNPARDAPNGEDTHSHEHWMRYTLHELTRWENGTKYEDNKPHYDVLVLLPGWRESKGALVEQITAASCGITILDMDASNSDVEDVWQRKYENLESRYKTVLSLLGGSHVILDFWKDGDVCHVVTTDGEELYDYQKWLDGHVPIYDKYSREILEIAKEFERVCGGTCSECEYANPAYPDDADEMCVLALRLSALADDA